MIQIRKSDERGHANHGWLDSRHTFSFADYHDPRHMHFRQLRVINEDHVAGGNGFGMHPHRDMEIVTYLLAGELEHKDSMGNGAVMQPGEVQRMTAGTGVYHSEYNHSPTEPLHLLQIWILPSQSGLTPGYEQKKFADAEKQNRLRLVVSPEGLDGSLKINQQTEIYVTRLDPGARVEHPLAPGRHAWVQVAKGKVTLNGLPLEAGDGAAVSREEKVELFGQEPAEVLLFDLA